MKYKIQQIVYYIFFFFLQKHLLRSKYLNDSIREKYAARIENGNPSEDSREQQFFFLLSFETTFPSSVEGFHRSLLVFLSLCNRALHS